MKKLFTLIAIVSCLGLFSCGIKGHNRAEIPAVNAGDERIYGDVGGVARQTKNTYADDETGKTAERVTKIRQKMYPK
ncbi:MAG: hypothetical protein MUE81_24130 [Thermoflexibacter sp.]|jgi:hypothetical protein|nr:hypothetical protein [Thermoflexibacter sp.]